MSRSVDATGEMPLGIMLKRVVIGALLLSIAVVLGFVIYVAFALRSLNFGSGPSEARIEADAWLASEVAGHTCMTQDDLRAIAAKRDWIVETHDNFVWCHSRPDLTNWTSVTIEPPLMMSTQDENRRYFGFDTQGCSADWSYSSC